MTEHEETGQAPQMSSGKENLYLVYGKNSYVYTWSMVIHDDAINMMNGWKMYLSLLCPETAHMWKICIYYVLQVKDWHVKINVSEKSCEHK